MAEMAATIRRMSSTDLHTELATARQELMTEKLTIAHLRSDCDEYRSMLETEQLKLKQVRAELATAQATIGAQEVFETIRSIPGVSPQALIEVMSGKLIQLQGDVEKQKGSLQQAQTQINSLQKLVSLSSSSSSSAAGGPSATATGAASIGLRASSRSSSPAPLRSRSPSITAAGAGHKQPIVINAEDDVHNVEDEEDEIVQNMLKSAASMPFSLVIDGQATPQKVGIPSSLPTVIGLSLHPLFLMQLGSGQSGHCNPCPAHSNSGSNY
jgi:ribosomal protein L29